MSHVPEATGAAGPSLTDAGAVSRKADDETGAGAESTGERKGDETADGQSQQAPAADLPDLDELRAARQKEFDDYAVSVKRRTAERGSARDPAADEETQTLLAEIAELKKAVAASRAEHDESRDSLEKQLSELRALNARLREKIGKLTADGDKKAK